MFHVHAEVLAKEEVTPGIFNIKLFSEEIGENAGPGQFVHVLCGEDRLFILRRPFSIHRVLAGNAFEIVFAVRGRGTATLAQVQPHQFVDMIGPLGRGFSIPDDLKTAMLVAGGMGVAPLMFLADALSARQVRLYVLQGARSREHLLYYMELKRRSRRIFTATDDGSVGQKGPVTDLLADAVRQVRPEMIYACGPREMLKKVALTALKLGVSCQVSVESEMACGVGACLSCACADSTGDFKLVCAEGPVFEVGELAWSE